MMLTNNSPPHYRPLIQWCLFKQYSHLLLNNKGIKALKMGSHSSSAGKNLRWIFVAEKAFSYSSVPLSSKAIYKTPVTSNRLGKVSKAHGRAKQNYISSQEATLPFFSYKKFNKYYFSKFIARNNTSKMHFYVHITLIEQYKVSSRSQ